MSINALLYFFFLQIMHSFMPLIKNSDNLTG
nr:MAG TPA: hypothetical protein [Caudoviricetes sp.]